MNIFLMPVGVAIGYGSCWLCGKGTPLWIATGVLLMYAWGIYLGTGF